MKRAKVLKGQKALMFDQPTTDYDVLSSFRNHEEWLTRKQIAERILRVKSPALIARIEKLVNEGQLFKEYKRLPNGVDMCIYARVYTDDGIPF